MRILIIAGILAGICASAVTPVLAQGKAQPTPKEMEAKRKSEELDKNYQDAMKRTPAAAVPAADPWSNVRSSETAPKTDGKTKK